MSKTTPEKGIPKKRPQGQTSVNECLIGYSRGSFSDSRVANFVVQQANHEVKKPTKGGNGSKNG